MTRFRRTKEEIASGLTPTEAKAKRFPLGELNEHDNPLEQIDYPHIKSKRKKAAHNTKSGEIVLRLRPGKDVDPIYFEHLQNGEIVVLQDENFYKWLDKYLSTVYDKAGSSKLFRDLLDRGLGELISHVHFEKDIQ